MIEARELTLLFDGEKDSITVAVDNLDITVGNRESIGIMGPSGSGKSSLLYLLSGLKKPTSGSVYYDSQDLSLLGENEKNSIRRERIGFIFQRHYLISHLTLLENILLPLHTVSNEALPYALELMQALGIGKYRDKKPHQLSVGERQKAAVLRAMVSKPEILFADEPTAALDMDSAMAVMDLLESIKDTTSLVVVTHDFKILKNMDRIFNLRDGRFV